MSESTHLLSDKRAITPLWIVALFVSLTETVLGVAVTQTNGYVQAALTAFVIVFPLLIACAFFAILWDRPYVFYPPTAFGARTNVRDYVAAMRVKSTLLAELSSVETEVPATRDDLEAVEQLVEIFLSRHSLLGLFYLRAACLSFTKRVPLNTLELNKVIGVAETDLYGIGVLVSASAVGFISLEKRNDLAPVHMCNITDINEKFDKALGLALTNKMNDFPNKERIDEAEVAFMKVLEATLASIEASPSSSAKSS